jgi:hypothetical protein
VLRKEPVSADGEKHENGRERTGTWRRSHWLFVRRMEAGQALASEQRGARWSSGYRLNVAFRTDKRPTDVRRRHNARRAQFGDSLTPSAVLSYSQHAPSRPRT